MWDTLSLHTGRYVFALCLICGVVSHAAQAQQTPPDSTQITPSSPQQRQTGEPANTPDVPDAVQFQSADSLIVDFRAGRLATLYGSSKVDHPSGKLTSGKIEMNLEDNTVEALASSPDDTLSMPVLTRDSEEIRSNRIYFNYVTQKGKFEAARVNVGEGHLIGSKVKNVSPDEVFIEDGIYSTCPPEYLYYYIKAKKMKVVDEDEIFFSNARIYILDIPYPIVFPFGYVPSGIEQRRSGLLTPTYVFDAQASRGIGLNNVGWFQYINDYLTTQVSADVFTSGTFYLDNQTQYRKTDSYSGSIGIGYSRDQGLEPTDPSFTRRVNKSLNITHNQTISPYANLAASVNLRTADFYKQNSFDIDQQVQTSSTSRLGYNYSHPEGLFRTGANTTLTQDFFNNITTLTGPTANFSLKTLSPFQDSNENTTSWYETINIRYSNNFRSEFEYRPIDADSAEVTFLDALFDPALYREATGMDEHFQFGFQQTATVGIGRILPSQFINTSANLSFNEYWVPATTVKTFNQDSLRLEESKELGFTTGRDFSASMSFSTTIYGISNRSIGKLQGFRHTLRPSVSLNYRPDFSDDKWGYYRTVQSDTAGGTQRYSIFENQILSGPGAGEQRSVSFSLSNIFETKVVDRDTTGEVNERTLRLIDNLSASATYNFAADSLNLSQLSTSFRTSVIDGVSLNAGASFSFYKRDSNGRYYNEFHFSDGGKLAQLERFNVSASTSFKGGNGRVETFTPIYRRTYDPYNQGIFSPIDPHFGYEPVAPLNSPWSFTLKFSYNWIYRFGQKPKKSATLNASNISFNLTPKWKFRTTLGYDFILKELTPNQFSLSRNLECWDLSFQISPFGDRQYYFFSLRLNSAQVQSLFQKLPILKNLERGSSPTGRRPSGF
jgi:hypothetical protein